MVARMLPYKAPAESNLEGPHESTIERKTDLRALQDHPPPRGGAGDLQPEPKAQTETGIDGWHA